MQCRVVCIKTYCIGLSNVFKSIWHYSSCSENVDWRDAMECMPFKFDPYELAASSIKSRPTPFSSSFSRTTMNDAILVSCKLIIDFSIAVPLSFCRCEGWSSGNKSDPLWTSSTSPVICSFQYSTWSKRYYEIRTNFFRTICIFLFFITTNNI